MKIEIEVPNIKTAADAINNAAIAYGDIVSALILGCDVPNKFKVLAKLSDDELMERFYCIKSIYEQLEVMENKFKEV
jgi:hypothetical protein